ncbi:MAG: hypothetical protein AAB426_09990 [Myxococcota bacterium]
MAYDVTTKQPIQGSTEAVVATPASKPTSKKQVAHKQQDPLASVPTNLTPAPDNTKKVAGNQFAAAHGANVPSGKTGVVVGGAPVAAASSRNVMTLAPGTLVHTVEADLGTGKRLAAATLDRGAAVWNWGKSAVSSYIGTPAPEGAAAPSDGSSVRAGIRALTGIGNMDRAVGFASAKSEVEALRRTNAAEAARYGAWIKLDGHKPAEIVDTFYSGAVARYEERMLREDPYFAAKAAKDPAGARELAHNTARALVWETLVLKRIRMQARGEAVELGGSAEQVKAKEAELTRKYLDQWRRDPLSIQDVFVVNEVMMEEISKSFWEDDSARVEQRLKNGELPQLVKLFGGVDSFREFRNHAARRWDEAKRHNPDFARSVLGIAAIQATERSPATPQPQAAAVAVKAARVQSSPKTVQSTSPASVKSAPVAPAQKAPIAPQLKIAVVDTDLQGASGGMEFLANKRTDGQLRISFLPVLGEPQRPAFDPSSIVLSQHIKGLADALAAGSQMGATAAESGFSAWLASFLSSSSNDSASSAQSDTTLADEQRASVAQAREHAAQGQKEARTADARGIKDANDRKQEQVKVHASLRRTEEVVRETTRESSVEQRVADANDLALGDKDLIADRGGVKLQSTPSRRRA